MFKKRFNGAKVLVTGHTGFKGSWLVTWLLRLGAQVTGMALESATNPSHFVAANLYSLIKDHRVNMQHRLMVEQIVLDAEPDFIFHLAAQPLVRESYESPVDTWTTNVIGTMHLLEAVRKLNKQCTVIVVTSDKCYENQEWLWGYRETDPLGGHDPYSASKAATELLTQSYIKSYFSDSLTPIRVATARAGNVIAGGDWSTDRIVPDCIRSWQKDEAVQLRNPHATRPWQHVLEPLSGYLWLAAALSEQPELHGEAFNFGPNANQADRSVLDLVSSMSRFWEKVQYVLPAPGTLLRHHEASLLRLSCDKALHRLGWAATLDFENTVELTAEWYRQFYLERTNALALTTHQIETYEKRAQTCHHVWAQ